ncbi:peptidase family M48 [Xylariales sp. PMI_506]|nr:peptidase family M48 [Xylariales sp. PMI_506]
MAAAFAKWESSLLRALCSPGLAHRTAFAARSTALAIPRRCPAPPSLILRSVRAPSRPFSQGRPPLRQPSHWGHDPEEQVRRANEQLHQARPLVTNSGLGRFVRSPSTHTVALLAFIGAVVFYFSNIQTVPVSGRRRFNCYSQGTVEAVCEQQVKHIIYEVERQGGRFLGDWDPRTRMVQRVMRRLIPVSGMEDANWEVWVIDDPSQANAFVLAGGKVFVYSGIIPIAKTDDGLAAVLGHEIAHNLAEHIGERMSGQIGINILLGSVVLLTALWGGALLGTQLFGGSLLDLLFSRPMGRKQESEADYIGLMMMAEACYNPEEALRFWQRMEAQDHMQPPEWMSTHPSNHNRIEKIREWLPKAMEKRYESDCTGSANWADRFKRALDKGSIIE